MVKITWLAHASFLINGDGLRIITDPYEPNEIMNLPPIRESVDIVVRSSDDDEAHCFVDTLPAGFDVVTATEIVDTGAAVRGLEVTAIWSQESLVHKDIPKDNAMYRFEVGGIKFAHMGDVGNFLTEAQMDELKGADVLFALAGGPPTIEIDDLVNVIKTVQPKIVIPMHYRIPGPRFFMLPVTELTGRFPADCVTWHDSSHISLTKAELPESTQIIVLDPTLVGKDE